MGSQKGNTKTENACLTISLGKLAFPCFCISGNPSPPESGSLIAVLVVVLVSDSSAITELQVLTTTSGGEGIVWKRYIYKVAIICWSAILNVFLPGENWLERLWQSALRIDFCFWYQRFDFFGTLHIKWIQLERLERGKVNQLKWLCAPLFPFDIFVENIFYLERKATWSALI